MSKYKVLTDGNGSGLIHVIGLGVYVPLSDIEKAAAENDALSQKLRAAQHEAEALAATVEALQSRVSAAERVEMMFSEVPEIIFEECEKLFPEEIRDARAEAGRAGFIAGAFWESNQVVDGIEQDCESEASKYAERVKAGVE